MDPLVNSLSKILDIRIFLAVLGPDKGKKLFGHPGGLVGLD